MSDHFKKVSPAALIALKEALAAIYWYKKDLRSFITYAIKNRAIVPTIDWQNNVKNNAVSELVDRMTARLDLHHDDLLSLFRPVDAGNLYKFGGVLSNKLKNTLGLFISINGFSSECTATKADALKAMFLMDGADLNAILDNRITLHEMLYRKRRHASQTGNIYLPVV